MKTLLRYFLFLQFSGAVLFAQTNKPDSLGLPGDNLNLYAVLKVFQESPTLEKFEESLNKEDKKINNLDLNKDDKIDYIRVIDNVKGNLHSIVLQTELGEKEKQDIAVIEVEKDKEGKVRVQIIGDEALYGKNYIIEPNYDEKENQVKSSEGTENPGYRETRTTPEGKTVYVTNYNYYGVAQWPVIQYIYAPAYVVWVSPWYWGYYPGWWSPWRPYYWHWYYGWHCHWHWHYYGHYRRWNSCRITGGRDFYAPRRSYSSNVIKRTADGDYRSTYVKPELKNEGYNSNTSAPKQPVMQYHKKDAVKGGVNPNVNQPRPKMYDGPTKTRPTNDPLQGKPKIYDGPVKTRPNNPVNPGKPNMSPMPKGGNFSPSPKPPSGGSGVRKR